MDLYKIWNTGLVEIRFSEYLDRVKNITIIDDKVLNLEIIPYDLASNQTMLNFTWNVTKQTEIKMEIQLYFKNEVYISSSAERDTLAVTLQDNRQFRSK